MDTAAEQVGNGQQAFAQGIQAQLDALGQGQTLLNAKVDSAVAATTETTAAVEELKEQNRHLSDQNRRPSLAVDLLARHDALATRDQTLDDAAQSLEPVISDGYGFVTKLRKSATPRALSMASPRDQHRSQLQGLPHAAIAEGMSPHQTSALQQIEPRQDEAMQLDYVSDDLYGVLPDRDVQQQRQNSTFSKEHPGLEPYIDGASEPRTTLAVRSREERSESVASSVTMCADDDTRRLHRVPRHLLRSPIPSFDTRKETSNLLQYVSIRQSIEPSSDAHISTQTHDTRKRVAMVSPKTNETASEQVYTNEMTADNKRRKLSTGAIGINQNRDVSAEPIEREQSQSPFDSDAFVVARGKRTLPPFPPFAKIATEEADTPATAALATDLLNSTDVDVLSPAANQQSSTDLPPATSAFNPTNLPISTRQGHDNNGDGQPRVRPQDSTVPKPASPKTLSELHKQFGPRTEEKENRKPSLETEEEAETDDAINFRGQRRSGRDRKPSSKLREEHVTPNEALREHMLARVTKRRGAKAARTAASAKSKKGKSN